jgi:hypothetical protein
VFSVGRPQHAAAFVGDHVQCLVDVLGAEEGPVRRQPSGRIFAPFITASSLLVTGLR